MSSSIRRWCLATLGAVALAVVLLLYTPPGLAWLGQLAGPLSDGAVRVEGLGGFFPNRLHAARAEISDSQGVWLRIDQPSLTWSALALLRNHVSAQDLRAQRIAVLRRPVPSRKAGGETPRIDIDHLTLARIELAAPVIGHAVTLSASGALHYSSQDQMAADLLVSRDGSTDSYRILGTIAAGAAHGTVSIREGADGILGRLAGLPGLGPVNLTARASGDRNANALSLDLSAGLLKADGRGTLRLAAREADLDFALSAPAMQPRPDISWQSLSGTAHFHGRFDTPALEAHLLLQDGTVGDLKARQLTLVLTGNSGSARLEGSAETVTLPGEYPDLFARAPVRFEAEADLRAAARPVRFALTHPLAELKGTARTRGGLRAEADLTVPSLAPFAALKQIDMRGTAGLHIVMANDGKRLRLTLNGKLDTQGTAIPARLLGRKATLDLDATLEGADLTQSRMQLNGAAIASDVSGSLRKGELNYRLALDVSDMSQLTRRLQGSLRLRGNANGPLGKEDLSASGSALLATQGFARQRVSIALQATGLSTVQEAKLNLDGRLDDSPLQLHTTWHNRQANLTGRWRSLEAKAGITVGKNTALAGQAHLVLRQMADLAVFTDQALQGTAEATVFFKPNGDKTGASIEANIKSLRTGTLAAQAVSLKGTVQDMTGKPGFALALVAQGLVAQGLAAQEFSGSAEAHLDGPLDRLEMTLASTMKDSAGTAWKGQAQARANLPKHQVTLTVLEGDARGITMKLAAPATFDFANGLKIDHLTLQSGKGRAEITGQIMPRLALTASASAIALADFR
ncbi:MAG TPA: hypothetical protein VN175_13240, partial [Rhizomicrobium sp.]|nr:hypothetical protein [Rhizomicrobium sp.]